MTTYELCGPYVADGALAARGGRIFVAFKPANEQRNTLYEVKIVNGVAQLQAIGQPSGTYYKDGGCALTFDGLTGELQMLSFCSPDPTTGGAARPVLWKTGVFIAGSLDEQLAEHEKRLDNIAGAAEG